MLLTLNVRHSKIYAHAMAAFPEPHSATDHSEDVRLHQVTKEHPKLTKNPALPANIHLNYLARNYLLKSRNPLLRTANNINEGYNNYNVMEAWVPEWSEFAAERSLDPLPCIAKTPPSFNQPKRTCSVLNRVRTGHSRMWVGGSSRVRLWSRGTNH